MVEHIHYKMLRNLILHITYLISRLHSSINKRIASLFEMISAIRGARQQHLLSMNAGSTLLQRRTVEMLVRRCTEPDMTGSSKASQFWDADAPYASASLVEMQKSPGLEGPLQMLFHSQKQIIMVTNFMLPAVGVTSYAQRNDVGQPLTGCISGSNVLILFVANCS